MFEVSQGVFCLDARETRVSTSLVTQKIIKKIHSPRSLCTATTFPHLTGTRADRCGHRVADVAVIVAMMFRRCTWKNPCCTDTHTHMQKRIQNRAIVRDRGTNNTSNGTALRDRVARDVVRCVFVCISCILGVCVCVANVFDPISGHTMLHKYALCTHTYIHTI